MANLDATRSNRNPSYKQMSNISNAAIRTHYRMLQELAAKSEQIQTRFRHLARMHEFDFDPLVVDW